MQARNNGIRVFGVGVGSGIDESEINEIANDPDSVHAFTLQDFSQLLSVLKKSLSESACKVSAPIPVNIILLPHFRFIEKPASLALIISIDRFVV